LATSNRIALGRYTGAVWSYDDLLQPVRAMAQDRRLGHDFRSGVQSLRWRRANGRLLIDPGASACRERQKGGSQNADVAASGDLLATRCMGRSRGGLTTKIHAVVDANGNPIALKLSEGQAHDGRSAADMLDSVGPGQTLLADRGYDSDALRQTLADRGAWANVKPMPGRVNVPVFSPYLYRLRNLVERFFNKLKHFRAIATRFEKHDANYLALVKLAAARIWMRFMSR